MRGFLGLAHIEMGQRDGPIGRPGSGSPRTNLCLYLVLVVMHNGLDTKLPTSWAVPQETQPPAPCAWTRSPVAARRARCRASTGSTEEPSSCPVCRHQLPTGHGGAGGEGNWRWQRRRCWVQWQRARRQRGKQRLEEALVLMVVWRAVLAMLRTTSPRITRSAPSLPSAVEAREDIENSSPFPEILQINTRDTWYRVGPLTSFSSISSEGVYMFLVRPLRGKVGIYPHNPN
jgi:hypothetical protein